VYMCIFMFLHIHVYRVLSAFQGRTVCVCVCVCARACVCVCVCVYVYFHVSAYLCVPGIIGIPGANGMRVCARARVCVCVCVCVCVSMCNFMFWHIYVYRVLSAFQGRIAVSTYPGPIEGTNIIYQINIIHQKSDKYIRIPVYEFAHKAKLKARKSSTTSNRSSDKRNQKK